MRCGCEVVENQCGSWRDLKDQYLLHVGRKGKTVHGTFDHRRSDQGVNGQSCDQGLGSPATKGRIQCQAFAARGPAVEPSEVRFTAVPSMTITGSGILIMAGKFCVNQSLCRCLTLAWWRSIATSDFFCVNFRRFSRSLMAEC